MRFELFKLYPTERDSDLYYENGRIWMESKSLDVVKSLLDGSAGFGGREDYRVFVEISCSN